MDDYTTDGSFIFLNETLNLKHNNTGSELTGSTMLTVSTWTVGILANSLIIIVVLFGSLRKYVIMNLLLALPITENVYLLVTIEKQRGIFGKMFIGQSVLNCRLSIFFLYVTFTISSWITVFIALERFIAVFYPFKVHIICTIEGMHISLY